MATKNTKDTKEQIEEIVEKRGKKFKFNDIVMPALGVVILLLLSVFVYVPMISTSIANREEQKELETKMDQLNKLQEKINSLDVTTMQQDLLNARKVIPNKLQVSDFAFYVDQLAKEKKLIFEEIFAGDVQIQILAVEGMRDDVRGVSGPLKYSGSFEDIVEFVDDLQEVSPFVISADNIELKQRFEEKTWEIALDITGFYLNDMDESSVNIYTPFTPYTKRSDVVSTFNLKAKQLDDGFGTDSETEAENDEE